MYCRVQNHNGKIIETRRKKQKMKKTQRKNKILKFRYNQPVFSHTKCLTYSLTPHTVHSSHHFDSSTNFFGDVYAYDSLKSTLPQEIALITMLHSSQTIIIPKVQQIHITNGTYDCWLFSLPYALELVTGKSPEKFLFDQTKIRANLKILPRKQ